jgi:hypothetical protein
MHRTAFLQRIIERTRARTYVEIGFYEGDNFFGIRAPRKFAVDPQFRIWRKAQLAYMLRDWRRLRDRYYEMPSDAFFASPPPLLTSHGIDVALVDGLHTHEQSLKDVLNCLRLLSPKGVIVLHDCNPATAFGALAVQSPSEAARQAPRDWDGMWSGDVWKTVAWLRSRRDDLRVFTLDCDFGLCVVMRGAPENRLPWSAAEVAGMTYRDLAANRMTLLNLKPAAFAGEFLAGLR